MESKTITEEEIETIKRILEHPIETDEDYLDLAEITEDE